MSDRDLPTIAVLGASGLIGEAVARRLSLEGFPVIPIARKFQPSLRARFGDAIVETAFVSLDASDLAKLLGAAEIVVNCIGTLQDDVVNSTDRVHRAFVEHLVEAVASRNGGQLLIHLSIPGSGTNDRTDFSRTKRAGERAIDDALIPSVIMRPGFVVASNAYGGSALMRALAALPFDLPQDITRRPFAVTDADDISRTIAFVATRWSAGDRNWKVVWDVMACERTTFGDVVHAWRNHVGGPESTFVIPEWFVSVGVGVADLVSQLGWRPPIRSAALEELRRGVNGDPEPWIGATGIEPALLEAILLRLTSTVQEKWFANLYLMKGIILGVLALFWIASGLIPLLVSFDSTTQVLVNAGMARLPAHWTTLATGFLDIATGIAIAVRRTSCWGLVAGVAISIFYLVSVTLVVPTLWTDPFGALVKVVPILVLMAVALAISNDR